MTPSKQYDQALAASKEHHTSSKTFSGKLMRPHAPFIKEIIDRHHCESVLDYGCGKARQYSWRNTDPIGSIPVGMTIPEFWGVIPALYDPAVPEYSKEPKGQFDIVIVTFVLGWIPVGDLPWVISRVNGLARRAVYIAEKIGDVGKDIMPVEMPRGWDRKRWRDVIRASHRAEVEVTLATREVFPDRGIIWTREIIAR